MLLMVYFCESACFPLIFALSLRGLGAHSKDAAKYQVSAIGFGAVFPGVYYAVLKKKGISSSAAAYAMCIPVALFGAVATYPIYLILRPRERKRLDRVPVDAAIGKRRPSISSRDTADHVELVTV
jgi:fucose permease